MKAEFGRILEEEKAVANVASKFNAIEPNMLERAAHSNSRNIKLLKAEMRSKLLEEPSKKAGREKYGIYLRPDDFTQTVSGRVLVVICLTQACIAMRINTCNNVYTCTVYHALRVFIFIAMQG